MKPSGCPRLFEVEALRDGRIGGAERNHFERHLAACPACSREARALDDLARALRSSPEPRGDELRVRRERTRLLAAFDGTLLSERHARAPERRWLTLATAAALAAGLLVFFVWHAVSAPAGHSLVGHSPAESAPSSAEFRADPGAEWSRRVEARRELVVLDRGTLWIHVAAAPQAPALLVQLPDGELEDIGTTFAVTVDGGRTTRVAVEEGRVLLRLRGREPIALGAGESWPSPALAAPSAQPAPLSLPAVPLSAAPVSAAPPLRPASPTTPGRSRARAADTDATAPHAADDFREAMAAHHAGQRREAAARFARFIQQHPGDARVEDAAYMRVLALRGAGDETGMRAAARHYLRRHPGGFRRAEVEALLR